MKIIVKEILMYECVCVFTVCLRLQSVNNARVCLCLCVCYILLFTNWQLTGTTLDNWLNIYRIYIGENQTIYKGRERERVVCVFFVVGRVKKYNFAVLRWIDPYNNAQKAFFFVPCLTLNHSYFWRRRQDCNHVGQKIHSRLHPSPVFLLTNNTI